HVSGCADCQERLEQRTRSGRTLPGRPSAPETPPPPAVALERLPAFTHAQTQFLARPKAPAGLGEAARPEPPAPVELPARLASTPSRRSSGTSTALRGAGRFVRRQFWVWPLVAAALLGGAGWWVGRSVESAMRRQRINELTTILNADVAALRIW